MPMQTAKQARIDPAMPGKQETVDSRTASPARMRLGG